MEIIESATQLIITARIGDGHLHVTGNSVKAWARYSSIDKQYMEWKKRILDMKYDCGNVLLKDNSAGFNKKGIIYTIATKVDKKIYKYCIMPRTEIIDSLDYFGFMVYYFDDGSWHKGRKIMNLYCNSFNEEEIEHLRNKIFELFGEKLCSVLWDKKKDGRKYPYLYIPKAVVNKIITTYKDYTSNNISTMLYKLGLPSQTIESQQ